MCFVVKLENAWKVLYMGKRKEFTRNEYYQCFWSSYGPKCENDEISLFMKKQKNITNNIYLILLIIKTLKCIESILYRKRDFKKRLLLEFMSIISTKTLKSMECTIYGKTKHYQKSLFSVFLSFLPNRYIAYKKGFMEKQYKFITNMYFKCFFWGNVT